jgi:hypothetical protein
MQSTTFSKAGKQILKDLLNKCTDGQQRIFKLMYARNGGKRSVEDAAAMPINEVVDLMSDDKIDWAICQCEKSVAEQNPELCDASKAAQSSQR